MTTLFDHVPHATLPVRAAPPTKMQDLLTEYRMSEQRRHDARARDAAETEFMADLERQMLKRLKKGETQSTPGLSVTREGGQLFFDWGT